MTIFDHFYKKIVKCECYENIIVRDVSILVIYVWQNMKLVPKKRNVYFYHSTRKMESTNQQTYEFMNECFP